jgi:transposase
MRRQCKRRSRAFKAKVALEAVKGDRTLIELARHFAVHPTQVVEWKQMLLAGASDLFARKVERYTPREPDLLDQHCREIGQMKAELNWLKKEIMHRRQVF